MTKGSVNSIESFGLVDGPGIRAVVFLNGCKLRCKFCHNPEMWIKKELNETPKELVKKLVRFKPYFESSNGGVTFSGGEPLLQSKFVLETCKLLKKENIHIALDTAGVGSDYDKLLDYVDLIIWDVKAFKDNDYIKMTGYSIEDSLIFIKKCQEKNKKIWIRQVIVPGINDNKKYILELKEFISKIKNVEKVELLPYHTMAIEKYDKLNIKYVLNGIKDMDKEKCKKLEKLLNEES